MHLGSSSSLGMLPSPSGMVIPWRERKTVLMVMTGMDEEKRRGCEGYDCEEVRRELRIWAVRGESAMMMVKIEMERVGSEDG